MSRFYIYKKQILNAILLIALVLAVLNQNADVKDFFIGFAASIALINFINSFRNRNKEDLSVNKDY